MEGDSRLHFYYEEQPQKDNKAVPFGVEESSGRNQCDTKQTPQPIKLIVKYGNLEQQTADVLSVPVCAWKADLECLKVTKALQRSAGDKFTNLFNFALNGRTSLPTGSVFEMPVTQESHSLNCKFVIFIALQQWNRAKNSEAGLKNGICELLVKCNSKNIKSLAMSAISTGYILAFPPHIAATIIGEETKNFVERNPNTSIKEIQIVIKRQPQQETLFIAFRETLSAMDFGNRVIVCDEHGVPFPKTQQGDCFQKQIGNLSVCVVYGDIVKETTSAIVNSTNFKQWKEGSVAHSIFSITGSEIIQEAQRGHKSGKKVIMTHSPNLKCDWILHCDCESKIETLKSLLSDIFQLCDETGLKSVSLPAIGTGECRLSPKCVAETITEAVCTVARKPDRCLSSVRLITFMPYIYHIFCAELQRRF